MSDVIMNMFRERAKTMNRMLDKDWEELDWSESDKEESKREYKLWLKDREYIEGWLSEYVKNKSPKTLKQYKSAIRIFFRWNLEENGGTPFFKLKKRTFLKYRNYLLEECMLASDSIKLKKSALSSFFNYLEQYISEEDDNYENFRNPLRGLALDLETNKVYDKKPVSLEEFKQVQKYLLEDENNKLMYAIWSAMFYTGNRISEIIQMKLSYCDLKIQEGYSFVEPDEYIRGKGRGKSGKSLKFKLVQDCIDALNVWKGARDNTIESEFLFVKRNNSIANKKEDAIVIIDDEYIRRYFVEIISPFIGRRITPHNMRASFSTYLLEQGADISVVKEWLNHGSIAVTSQFYDLRDKNDLANEAMKNIRF